MNSRWTAWVLGSVRRQLVVGMAVVVTSTLLLMIWDQTRRQREVLSQQQADQAMVLASNVATSSALWLVSRDVDGLQALVDSLRPYPDLKHLMILDAQGRVLAHTDLQRRGLYLPDLPDAPIQQVLPNAGPLIDVMSPVFFASQMQGWVRVGLGTASLEERLRQARRRGIWLTLGGVLASIVLAALTGRYLTRRLDAIRRVASVVEAGDAAQRVALAGQDEAAWLARQFNGMLDALAQREAALLRSERRLSLAASVFTHAREGILITDANEIIVEVNDAFCRITGFAREEVLGQTPRLLSSKQHAADFFAGMWQQLGSKGHWYGELWNRRKNGDLFAEMLTITAVRDAAGQTLHYVGLFFDITALKEHERQLSHIAHYDALTHLPNRVLLADRLHQGMIQEQRRGRKLAVLFLDLDGFKAINDRHGHAVGDQMLIAVASRMKQALRESDTLARIGGDEFVAVLGDLDDPGACVHLLMRLLSAASMPIRIGELQLQVTASIGVTSYPQQQELEADQLLRQADQAMYQAKLAGKNRFVFFDADQDSGLRSRFESVERIRQALVDREFVLYYQPKVNMRSGQVIGAEALIRWQHPDNGLLAPGQFLPSIENHPLSVVVGEWVIGQALAQIADWQSQGLTLAVSVNVGARQLQQSDFVSRLRSLLSAQPQVAPALLEIEILETSALEDLARVSQVVEDCSRMGVRFAMDDFGTGYSSLTYLRQLGVHVLKIDQSFVRDMLDDPDDLAILQGVIGLAQSFRREVIAEGVETVEHGALLLQLGCETAQGYGIAQPMPADALPAWLAGWQPAPIWRVQQRLPARHLLLLYAQIEHRAWVSGLRNHVMGERGSPPTLDERQCFFGRWLTQTGQGVSVQGRVAPQLLALHSEIHQHANQLMALQALGQSAQAQAQLPALEGLRDRLLQQLEALAREMTPQAGPDGRTPADDA